MHRWNGNQTRFERSITMVQFTVQNGPYKLWETASIPQQDADGKAADAEIRLLFAIPTEAEWEQEVPDAQALLRSLPGQLENLAAGKDAAETIEKIEQSRKTAFAAIAKRVEDWRGMVDEAGAPVDFDRDLLAQLMGYRWFAEAVAQAFHRAREGRRAKN